LANIAGPASFIVKAYTSTGRKNPEKVYFTVQD
jgi:hypothetical protein